MYILFALFMAGAYAILVGILLVIQAVLRAARFAKCPNISAIRATIWLVPQVLAMGFVLYASRDAASWGNDIVLTWYVPLLIIIALITYVGTHRILKR